MRRALVCQYVPLYWRVAEAGWERTPRARWRPTRPTLDRAP